MRKKCIKAAQKINENVDCLGFIRKDDDYEDSWKPTVGEYEPHYWLMMRGTTYCLDTDIGVFPIKRVSLDRGDKLHFQVYEGCEVCDTDTDEPYFQCDDRGRIRHMQVSKSKDDKVFIAACNFQMNLLS